MKNNEMYTENENMHLLYNVDTHIYLSNWGILASTIFFSSTGNSAKPIRTTPPPASYNSFFKRKPTLDDAFFRRIQVENDFAKYAHMPKKSFSV